MPKDDNTTTLYRFFDSDGTLLYVGITSWVEGRFSEHRRLKPWEKVAVITLEHLPTRRAAFAAEAKAIKAELPLWNIALNARVRELKGPVLEAAEEVIDRVWCFHPPSDVMDDYGFDLEDFDAVLRRFDPELHERWMKAVLRATAIGA